jgi:tight adherence protein B
VRRRVLLVALLAAVLGSFGFHVPGAGAQDDAGQSIGIREIDARDPEQVSVSFSYSGDRADVDDVGIRVDGELVNPSVPPVPLADERALGVVLLIDTSLSMNDGGAIERAREAALAFVAAKNPADEVAIVSFSDEVQVLQDFTTSPGPLRAAVRALAPAGESAVLDGVVRGASLFEDVDVQPNILLLSDGGDRGSEATLDRALGVLATSGSTLFSVLLDTGDGDPATVQRMVEATGGRAVATTDPAEIEGLFADVQETLRRQYVVTFPSPERSGAIDVVLSIGSAQATGQFTAGSRQEGSEATRPVSVAEPSGPGFLRGSVGLVLALALALAAVCLLVYSLASTFLGGDDSLDFVLRPYDESYVAPSDDDERSSSMAQTQLVQRAVKMTGEFAQRRGALAVVEGKLERADLPLRPPEALFFYAAGVAMVALLTLAITQALVPTVLMTLLALAVPAGILDFLARRRRKQFQALLPDTLQLLSSTLRAGYSLMQGVEAVSHEVAEPMGRELRRVVTEARLGRPLEESMAAVADRMDSGDFAWAVMAVGIQREVGGNLSELLLTVSETMTERERLRRDVNALTAEGRVSAMVLGALPIGLGLFISGANPGYLGPLFDTTMGNVFIAAGLLLMGIGIAWMWKIIQIEV